MNRAALGRERFKQVRLHVSAVDHLVWNSLPALECCTDAELFSLAEDLWACYIAVWIEVRKRGMHSPEGVPLAAPGVGHTCTEVTS